jgi:hypothetical protein
MEAMESILFLSNSSIGADCIPPTVHFCYLAPS